MKRFRDKNGQLTKSIEAIKKRTQKEASNYYKPGHIYLNNEDGREYVLLMPEDEICAHFKSFDGYNVFIPFDSLGTFLPDVADDGNEIIFVE